MKKSCLILMFLFCLNTGYTQTISGTFPQLAGEELRLEGFDGFEAYPINNTEVSDDGNFVLNYSKDDIGMGQLVSANENPFVVILSGEDIKLKGERLDLPETIEITKGKDNQLFDQYAGEHSRREQALNAWIYLRNIYRSDSLFAVRETPRQNIKKEIQRIQNEDQAFLKRLDPQSYLSWYLPVRKLVSSVSVVAQHRPDEIPETIESFRQLDYTDRRLYKSGLLKDAINSHVWLIENSGRSLDSVFVELNHLIDEMLNSLSRDKNKPNEISSYLFDLLERRSLFESSEYLALKMLNEMSDSIQPRLANKLEKYRAMKIGNTVSDMLFPEDTTYPDHTEVSRLSELQSPFTLVAFASGSDNSEEIEKLKDNYENWLKNGVEVVFVSLDEISEECAEFASQLPFIIVCETKNWESKIAQDYYVYKTPVMYLLDSEREIVLHPKSMTQMNAWVDWNLMEGNR